MSETKNDIAWERLFQKYSILEKIRQEERAVISSTQINEFREARLMTKFDHHYQLPKVFVENDLALLPISRGSYVIGRFKIFNEFEDCTAKEITITPPSFLESIDYSNITSEAVAINCAFISQILTDFTGEERLYPTVNGRMGTSIFDFSVTSVNSLTKIHVENVQIEIDGGYEGDESLNLIEAKNYIEDDFLIRQLYYPYRHWKDKMRKKVRPIFLTYSNGIFYLREYKFENPEHYNSITLIQYNKYQVKTEDSDAINVETIQNLLDELGAVKEPDVPFPQADSFERVISLCELVKKCGLISKEDITREYGFDYRQTNYYSSAGKYLGLIHEMNGSCELTYAGSRIFGQSLGRRQLEFIKVILVHEPFRETLRRFFQKGEAPSKNEVVEIMKHCDLYNIHSDETYRRRASTVVSWVNWIIGLIEE